ncbi:MAG: type II methionyl aminopeptidase [Nanoarchaeota archaeon]|nr:type II methionyl aminopeptidase [Nanoarchaeota archaeon]
MSYEKAGKIAAEALQYGRRLIKPGIKLSEVVKKVEEKIIADKGAFAFPPQISMNNITAHYYPDPSDDTEFKEEDLVKLDLGVQINGHIADTALTVDLSENNEHLELVKASKDALKEALTLFTPETPLTKIGKAIEEVIVGYGFQPIRNLSGHEIKPYELHAGLTVPNFNNKDRTPLEENQVFAVEPFATTGDGYVKDGKPSGIYKLVNPKNSRSGRDVLNFIIDNFKTLPFHKSQILKKFGDFKGSFGLRILEREEIIHQYPQLVERSGGIVSQAEHTVIVKDKPIITTKI